LSDLAPEQRALGAPSRTPPATASDYVADHVRSSILHGRLELGSKLDQQALADELGVSTIPVREGLRRLEAEGLVRILPRRGAYVAEVSTEEIIEVARIRVPLEELAIKLAAPKLGADDLLELRRMNAELDGLTGEEQASEWGALNRVWHLRLYQGAGSPMLLQMISMLWDRSTLYRQLNNAQVDHRRKSVVEHASILEALEQGDAAGAARGLRRHIQRSAAEAPGLRTHPPVLEQLIP
jgi:DNA-binding GntR family transcriptional regulator